MLMKVLEFFKNLPPKKCVQCGREIEEQHECYGNTCENCLGVAHLHFLYESISSIPLHASFINV